jgi:hypothetical protein
MADRIFGSTARLAIASCVVAAMQCSPSSTVTTHNDAGTSSTGDAAVAADSGSRSNSSEGGLMGCNLSMVTSACFAHASCACMASNCSGCSCGTSASDPACAGCPFDMACLSGGDCSCTVNDGSQTTFDAGAALTAASVCPPSMPAPPPPFDPAKMQQACGQL